MNKKIISYVLFCVGVLLHSDAYTMDMARLQYEPVVTLWVNGDSNGLEGVLEGVAKDNGWNNLQKRNFFGLARWYCASKYCNENDEEKINEGVCKWRLFFDYEIQYMSTDPKRFCFSVSGDAASLLEGSLQVPGNKFYQRCQIILDQKRRELQNPDALADTLDKMALGDNASDDAMEE